MKHDAIKRAAKALEYAWETNPDCPGEMYAREAKALARAAILAFLDDEGKPGMREFIGAILNDFVPYPREELAAQAILNSLRALVSDDQKAAPGHGEGGS